MVHAMTVKLVDLDKILTNGVEASETCGVTKVAEDMRGPEHPENPIVKMFLGANRWQAKLLRKKTGDETISAYNMATVFWMRQAQPATRKAFKEKKLQQLTLWERDGMVVVSGRAMEGLNHYFGVDHLPVLISSTRVAELIMLHAHASDHGGGMLHW